MPDEKTTHVAPHIDCERHHTNLAVTDVLAAVDFYTKKLGFTLGFTCGDPVTMAAGVNLGEVQIFFQQGTPSPKGCSVFFVVGNADELYEFQRGNGVEIVSPPGDRPYGLRDYRVRDLYGYELEFGHYIYNQGPPLKIKRVDVPVRLEKRLAALLHDLAAHKRMSLSSCLEEILLHTNEPLGDGVASPHTKATLRHIQELKKKHGIDYDSHASYRFVEE
jgi:catechol 2,3-dioxygenase-like lactoylglutathione lyase family enzyme